VFFFSFLPVPSLTSFDFSRWNCWVFAAAEWEAPFCLPRCAGPPVLLYLWSTFSPRLFFFDLDLLLTPSSTQVSLSVALRKVPDRPATPVFLEKAFPSLAFVFQQFLFNNCAFLNLFPVNCLFPSNKDFFVRAVGFPPTGAPLSLLFTGENPPLCCAPPIFSKGPDPFFPCFTTMT